jgi:hypothetical protein
MNDMIKGPCGNPGEQMITSLGLIGKAVELLVCTVSKKKIDFALDDKKKAAKAFVRLHESILGLEVISDGFLAYIQGLKDGRNTKLYSVHMGRVLADLRPASLEFVQALAEVSPVLALYDRDLQRLLGSVSVMKRGLLKNFFYIVQGAIIDDIGARSPSQREGAEPMLLRFQSSPVDRSFCALSFTVPSDMLIDAELPPLREIAVHPGSGDFYGDMFDLEFSDASSELLSGDRGHDTADATLRERPRMRIDLFEVIQSNVESVDVGYLEINKLIDLHPRLKRHHAFLAEVRESLRQFIEARFSLCDVLYVAR